jgi:hypothetical protein
MKGRARRGQEGKGQERTGRGRVKWGGKGWKGKRERWDGERAGKDRRELMGCLPESITSRVIVVCRVFLHFFFTNSL